MSYDVSLMDESGIILEIPEAFQEGGTQIVGGTSLCDLNITYNYFKCFGTLVRDLHGKVAHETIQGLLDYCVNHAEELPEPDYWKSTHGNAAMAIRRLIRFARAHPHGIWSVT